MKFALNHSLPQCAVFTLSPLPQNNTFSKHFIAYASIEHVCLITNNYGARGSAVVEELCYEDRELDFR
jgi:hypothetical protein